MNYISFKQKKLILTSFFIFFFSTLLSYALAPKKNIQTIFLQKEPELLEIFRKAYPNVKFCSTYDKKYNDYLINIIVKSESSKKREANLYWCDARFLPEQEIANKDKYRSMLYLYSTEIPDPKNFTEADIAEIKDFTSSENRRNGAIEPPFLYDIIYNCISRAHTEEQIVKVNFLTKSINVHKNIAEKIEKISNKITALPPDNELQTFFSTLSRTDGYAWRSVRDTQSRSFHSLGLAIDILPKGYYQKIIYWGWQKQIHPKDWYMTPLSKRWTPPKQIIELFREEGFIWGGTWIVWDNMHFEYRPELLEYKYYCEKFAH
ncbi:MAG: M15 family metallopeptidase [Treponema sp.]|nr:M15 family metallopeptidase [Treponema sp.]